MKTLILGGVRSGKSRLAESLAINSGKQVLYVATATIGDDEMQARIDQHKANRPDEWIIVEEPLQLANVIKEYSNKNYSIVIDCLTLWITNLLLADDNHAMAAEREALINVLKEIDDEITLVSNETGMGIIPLGDLTRRFGDEAGITNQLIATICDRVILTVAGLPLVLKGESL